MHTLVPAPRRLKADRAPREAITAFGRPLHRITVEQYHRMQENGAIQKQDRCELIRGFLLERPRISPQHASCSSRLVRELFKLFGFESVFRFRLPITLSDSEPEPDAVLAEGADEDYFERHPGPEDILFLIEVSDSSLNFDRTVKLPLYAEAGIPHYWIINVAAKSIEVYRNPRGGKKPEYRKPATYGHSEPFPSRLPRLELPFSAGYHHIINRTGLQHERRDPLLRAARSRTTRRRRRAAARG